MARRLIKLSATEAFTFYPFLWVQSKKQEQEKLFRLLNSGKCSINERNIHAIRHVQVRVSFLDSHFNVYLSLSILAGNFLTGSVQLNNPDMHHRANKAAFADIISLTIGRVPGLPWQTCIKNEGSIANQDLNRPFLVLTYREDSKFFFVPA